MKREWQWSKKEESLVHGMVQMKWAMKVYTTYTKRVDECPNVSNNVLRENERKKSVRDMKCSNGVLD